MGGKSKSVTVGYKHYVGMHWVFAHGPLDLFSRVSVDDRVAWQGSATGGTIAISADELFGGESREGGVSGSVDVEMGEITQTKNAYLLSKIGANIPAYRGVAAMVFKDFYWGNNPYLKPVSARGQRIYAAQDGAEQWLSGLAGIYVESQIGAGQVLDSTLWRYKNDALGAGGDYSATGYDDSAWPSTLLPIGDQNNGTASGAGLRGTPETIIPTQRQVWLRGNFYLSSVPGDVNVTGYVDNGVTMWVNGVQVHTEYDTFGHTTNFTVPGSAFVAGSNQITFKVVDDSANAGIDRFYFDIKWNLIPGDYLDMNPAHIIRECLTNQDWGMGYSEDDIDEPSFTAAAQTLYQEAMGISLLWDKQAKIEDFINEIVRHIDAALFVSRTTGKFVLKLIRDDYDVGSLITLDESNIEKIGQPSRPAFGELVNSVTVAFWQNSTGRDDSVTVQDPAGVQMQGAVINTTLQYPGFSNTVLASRAAARDLQTLSNPFLTCTIYTGDVARDLDIGDVFILNWAKWKLSGVVMRVTGFAMSEGKSNEIRLTCVEDVFATPSVAVIAPPGDGWTDPSQPPEPTEFQIAFEAPYYELTQINGQSNTDSDLTTNPLQGYVMAAAVRPASAINAKLWTDAGDGFEESDTMDFCPSGTLAAALNKTTEAAILENGVDLDLVVVGTHFQINDELLRIDSIDAGTGAITFGRGVLDTVPGEHAAGDRAYFWDSYSGGDPTEYASGETVDVRITPVSGAGQVALADAPEVSVTLDQRAYRPYPPGNLTINGDSYVDTSYDGDLTVEWVGRDRTQQTSGTLADHFDGEIGPEAGTTYRIRTYVDDVLVDEQEPATSPATVSPPGDGVVRVEVWSKRDEVYSLFAANHTFPYSITAARYTEGGDLRNTENGDIRVTED